MNDAARLLTDHQRAVADRVLDEESVRRHHLVIALSGAHAYGFASPDSDLDLKSIHIAPTEQLLGLTPPRDDNDRMEVIEGVEIDYTSNELGGALRGILKGNGNYLERVLGECALRAAPQLDELRPIAAASLSRRLLHHYRGFATSQLHEWEKTGGRSAKKALYVLRTTLTGTHALRTGTIVTDVTRLLDDYGFAHARELIAVKQSAERASLADDQSERWRRELARAFEVLDESARTSPLPDDPPNTPDVAAWLVETRRRMF